MWLKMLIFERKRHLGATSDVENRWSFKSALDLSDFYQGAKTEEPALTQRICGAGTEEETKAAAEHEQYT